MKLGQIDKGELKFKIKYTHELSKADLYKIISLKRTFWKHSLESQKTYLFKNYKKKDKHIMLFKKNLLVGYNCLKNIYLDKFKYLLLDSFVVRDFYRGKGISNILLSKSMNEILNENKTAYLLANKNSYKLYSNFADIFLFENLTVLLFVCICVIFQKYDNYNVLQRFSKKINLKILIPFFVTIILVGFSISLGQSQKFIYFQF